MRREIEITNAKIVMTKDELGYSEVLDDFTIAEFIYIVTYNISANNPTLLNKLKEASNNTEIKVFTNIPSRFNDYYYEWASTKAKTQIDSYLIKLDPEQFNELFSSFFVFNNHAKIIMTNRMAYIGSSNYSSESANSIEAGVIIEDEQAILQIKDMINEEVQSQAESYYVFDILPLIFQARELEEIRTVLSENIWGIWDFHGIEQGQYYKGPNIYLDTKIITAFENLKEDIGSTLFELIQDISEEELSDRKEAIIKQLSNVKDVISGYEIGQEVIDFLEFDESGHINDLMEENTIFMTEDVLDEYVQGFTQQAYEIKHNLALDAHDGFIEFESFLTTVIQLFLESVEELRALTNHRVDNTR
ncbi:hypothetical protein J6TS1_48120 [Siminovitchia terrae]|uniref:PLD phosphodiesterase domain-containing protein n=1 Tax=Siminovitchia terrae TaxID=1914933 RepID=A0ABQ4L3T3_SIMTE|nr:hypothetical protein [Siminovitchia terrae]GIN98942.1 hypothetical protein J6TS1_48120 [Siminovitchia terrae]